MSKRKLVAQELDRLSETDLDRVLAFLRALAEEHADASLAAESALAKDWLAPEEDAAWASLDVVASNPKSPAAKLASIREAVRHSFPTGDIEEINREIERGYQS